MNPEDIKLGDWQRILVGDVPGGFYWELLIRAVFGYVLLMLSMRLLGSRMASQLSRTEMAALVSLAAAVGVPLLSPERGLLPAAAVAVVVVVVVRTISTWATKNSGIEAAADGAMSVLLDNSLLQFKAMGKSRITRERLFAHLRSEGVTQLGKVRRVYLEANGTFTIVPEPEPRPGLSVIPEWDGEFVQRQRVSRGVMVCHDCGRRRDPPDLKVCPNCEASQWVDAVV